jgi:hypothetical protein|tara:strand:+ start:384 stop:590 length:207 start_codon:yes stop_codon:yes gene_type:complete
MRYRSLTTLAGMAIAAVGGRIKAVPLPAEEDGSNILASRDNKRICRKCGRRFATDDGFRRHAERYHNR